MPGQAEPDARLPEPHNGAPKSSLPTHGLTAWLLPYKKQRQIPPGKNSQAHHPDNERSQLLLLGSQNQEGKTKPSPWPHSPKYRGGFSSSAKSIWPRPKDACRQPQLPPLFYEAITRIILSPFIMFDRWSEDCSNPVMRCDAQMDEIEMVFYTITLYFPRMCLDFTPPSGRLLPASHT